MDAFDSKQNIESGDDSMKTIANLTNQQIHNRLDQDHWSAVLLYHGVPQTVRLGR
jgi:hypothetical protein